GFEGGREPHGTREPGAYRDRVGRRLRDDRDVADPARGAVREAHRAARGPRARGRPGAHPARPLPVAAGRGGGVHAARVRVARAARAGSGGCRVTVASLFALYLLIAQSAPPAPAAAPAAVAPVTSVAEAPAPPVASWDRPFADGLMEVRRLAESGSID